MLFVNFVSNLSNGSTGKILSKRFEQTIRFQKLLLKTILINSTFKDV